MTPRSYRMTKRAEATEETRRRIIEATLGLHTTKGFESTSWQDIADRAEVAVGTVYYHFPTFDELIPACSSLGVQLAQPPTPEIFRGIRSKRSRIETLVREQYAYYERARGGLHNVVREKHQIPALGRLAAETDERTRVLVLAALGARSAPKQVDLVQALLAFRVWESLIERGIGKEATIAAMSHLIGCAMKISV